MKLGIQLMFNMIGCLFLHSVSYAHCCWTKDNPGFYDLRIDIRNLGVETCNLERKDIHNGELYGSNIPDSLPSDGKPLSLTLSGPIVDLSLVYNCGNNKRITLSMKQYIKKNHKHTSIEAYSANAVDVFEQHTIQPSEIGCCSSHDRFGRITWDLTH